LFDFSGKPAQLKQRKHGPFMLKEFKQFAIKGNVIDMAVGIMIGGAFGTIVKSLVDDILMPPIGLLMGGVDFRNFFVTLKKGAIVPPEGYPTLAAAKEAGAVTLNYGLFFNALISFLILAWAVFLLVKMIERLRRKEKEEPSQDPAVLTRDQELLIEIRDALRSK
jgi:large conductance mechanosensitive channel